LLNPIRTILDRVQGKAPPGAKRSPKWSAHRRRYMKLVSRCEICPRKIGLEAHHIVPFHLAPDLELQSDNLIALCRRCHLFVGHLGSWRDVNISVLSDAKYWRFRMEGG
jgi:5-methylcytosine-specific restriction endonuclease McrA